MARLLILSPYHGGSHRLFAEGLAARTAHRAELLTLPPRFWKWRMRGAALVLSGRARRLQGSFDAILASDMLNLAEFRALSRIEAPSVLYMHENQLTYPMAPTEVLDRHFGFTNVVSALAADRVVFNSRSHRRDFLEGIPRLVQAMPDCPPRGIARRVADKSRVIPVGLELQGLARSVPAPPRQPGDRPLILWNHRWEHDKRPEDFFRVLERLDGAGIEFDLALAGDNAGQEPEAFAAARQRHQKRLVQYGRVDSRDGYARLLRRADVVVSTAVQENFGVSIVEAVALETWPLLPRRLSYPEILPRAWHPACLYDDLDGLERRLAEVLRAPPPESSRRRLAEALRRRYDWSALIGTYDDLIDGLAPGGAEAC